jgi:hypothetical protein
MTRDKPYNKRKQITFSLFYFVTFFSPTTLFYSGFYFYGKSVEKKIGCRVYSVALSVLELGTDAFSKGFSQKFTHVARK